MMQADELNEMVEKAKRYIKSAEILRLDRDFDSAVSRLYYAMFYCAEALLLTKGYTFSKHREVISAFAQHFIKPGLFPKEFHKWLRNAFEKRQVSDYEFGTRAGDKEVVDLKTKAEQFLLKTEEFLRTRGYL